MNQNEQKLRDALFSIKCKAEHEYKCTNSTGFSDIQAAAEQTLAHVNETPKTEHVEPDVLKKSGNVDMIREALQLAVRQNEHDMLLTGEELRQCRQALAAEPDQTPCPICESEAVKQFSYVCKKCGADFADAECNTENIKHWHAAEPAPDVFELNAQIAELKTSNAKLRRIAERGAEFEAQIIKAKAQLVPEIADAHRTLAKWLNEEIDAPIDRKALSKVLAATQCLAVKECVTTEPAQREPGGTMTPDRAAYFMRRFKAEEKLLGPNEQAAIDLVIAMLTDPKQPAQKLVRLTKGEINCIAYQTIDTGRVKAEQVNNFAKAIMDAMIAKNGGKHD